MRRLATTIRLLAAATLSLGGCMGPPLAPLGSPPLAQNPAFVGVANGDYVFQQTVDVVDDHFTIDHEEPVRTYEGVITEGRIDAFPETGSTVFEPWRGDSANGYERLESTLQSIRRTATVRVIPTDGGFLVDVAVFKELEDVSKPDYATVGEATFRHDGSLKRYVDPILGQPVNRGWIPLGRDAALEQRMLAEICQRMNAPPQRLY